MIGVMDNFEAGIGVVGQDAVLEVRVALVDSEPEIWRRFELRGSLALSQVHQVLQAAFGWEDAHLHGFLTSDPFAPLRPVDGESSGGTAAAAFLQLLREAFRAPGGQCRAGGR